MIHRRKRKKFSLDLPSEPLSKNSSIGDETQVDQKVYQEIIGEIIRSQVEVLGKDVAIKKAEKVKGFTIDSEGFVYSITDDPVFIIQSLVNEYFRLSADSAVRIASRIAKRYLLEYPDIRLPRSLMVFEEDKK